MADLYVKRGDTAPPILVVLTDARDTPVDLTGATVRFKMRLASGGTLKVDAEATVLDAARGAVRYAWASADTDTAGDYVAEFQATFGDGTVESFPNSGNLTVSVTADLP